MKEDIRTGKEDAAMWHARSSFCWRTLTLALGLVMFGNLSSQAHAFSGEDPNDECPTIIPPSFTFWWKAPEEGGPVEYYRVYLVPARNLEEAKDLIDHDRGKWSKFTLDPTTMYTVHGLTDGRWYFGVAGINHRGQGKISKLTCGRVLAPIT